MKLHIAICDDIKAESDFLTKLVREWAAEKSPATIKAYDSAETFLFAYETDKVVDILLLDIRMKALDGISLAKKLRADGGQMQIVFITGFPDFIAEGYEVSALHYLIKPVEREKLFAVLDKALVMLEKAEETILIDTADAQTKLPLREILYAEAFSHTINIQTLGGEFEAKLSISELESLLGGDFCRVHRSYLVGLRHVRQITKTDVIMDNGKAIPLSRRRYNAVNKAFIGYYKGAE